MKIKLDVSTQIITFSNELRYSPVFLLLEWKLRLFILMGKGNRKKFGVKKKWTSMCLS